VRVLSYSGRPRASTTVNSLMARQGLRELVDLARVRAAGKQDQFVAAGLREGVDGVAEAAGCGERFSHGLLGSGAEEPVVVAQVGAGIGLGGRAEREAGAGQQPGVPSRPAACHVAMARAAPARKGARPKTPETHPVPWLATRRNAAGEKPPNNNGGPPGVAGFGPISASRSRQMVVTRSSGRSRSAPRRRNEAPAAAKSSSRGPGASPSSSRPPASRSRLAACLAKPTWLVCNGASSTVVAKVIRVVTAAAAASTVSGS
jgi:hypothetical protein